MADRWKLFERGCLVFGLLISAATLYYTAAPYYHHLREEQPATSPPTNVGIITMAPPWWLIALGAIGVLLLITGWAMMALRRKTSQIHGRLFPIETGVYIGQIAVSIDKLDSDLFLGISIICYNGTTKFVSIDSVNGFIAYEDERLPTPTIIGDKSVTEPFPTAKEFSFVLEQRVPRKVADHILKTLIEKNRAMFSLSSLNILAFFPPSREFSSRINLWDGLTLDQSGRSPLVGRVISLGKPPPLGSKGSLSA
jgi:hypothetical protein